MIHVLLFPVYLILAASLIYTILYWPLKFKAWNAVDDAVDEMLGTATASPEDLAQAMLDIYTALQADKSIVWWDFTAPWGAALALIGLPKSARKLPKWGRKWDNNVSVNGDGSAVLRDGEWVNLRGGEKERPGERVYTYDDPEFKGKAYYMPKWLAWISADPRNYFVRWWWLVRNRASQLSVDVGAPVVGQPDIISGSIAVDHKGKYGHFLMKHGPTFHYKSFTPMKLLGKWDMVVIRSVGHKLELAYKHPSTEPRNVAATAIGYSFKGLGKPD